MAKIILLSLLSLCCVLGIAYSMPYMYDYMPQMHGYGKKGHYVKHKGGHNPCAGGSCIISWIIMIWIIRMIFDDGGKKKGGFSFFG